MRQVQALLPVSRPTIYDLMATAGFPQQVKVKGRSFWPKAEVESWLQAKADERGQ